MKKEIKIFIEEKLKQNVSKSEIEKELSQKYQPEEYKWLSDYAEPEMMKKYKILNWFLIFLLTILLLLKIFNLLFWFMESDIFKIISNLIWFILIFYIIRWLYFFKSSSYQILFWLASLATLTLSNDINELINSFNLFLFFLLMSQFCILIIPLYLLIKIHKKKVN